MLIGIAASHVFSSWHQGPRHQVFLFRNSFSCERFPGRLCKVRPNKSGGIGYDSGKQGFYSKTLD